MLTTAVLVGFLIIRIHSAAPIAPESPDPVS